MVSCRVCKTSFEAGSYRDDQCPGCHALMPVSMRSCPLCTVPFERRVVAGVMFDECQQCGGVFLDRQTQERVDAEPARGNALIAGLSHGADKCVPSSWRPLLPCPACRNMMQRAQSPSPWVVLDVCRAHGTFYDAGELPYVVEVARRHAQRTPEHTPPPRNANRMNDIAMVLFVVAFLLLECCRAAFTYR